MNGVGFFARQAARQRQRGDDRDEPAQQHHQAVAMSQNGLYRRRRIGFCFGSLKPQVSPRPSKPEPLLADAELNS